MVWTCFKGKYGYAAYFESYHKSYSYFSNLESLQNVFVVQLECVKKVFPFISKAEA